MVANLPAAAARDMEVHGVSPSGWVKRQKRYGKASQPRGLSKDTNEAECGFATSRRSSAKVERWLK